MPKNNDPQITQEPLRGNDNLVGDYTYTAVRTIVDEAYLAIHNGRFFKHKRTITVYVCTPDDLKYRRTIKRTFTPWVKTDEEADYETYKDIPWRPEGPGLDAQHGHHDGRAPKADVAVKLPNPKAVPAT